MTGALRQAWTTGGGSLVVRVRVTVKASKDQVDGLIETAEGQAIGVRVRAIPAEGEANAAVRDLLAGWLRLAKTSVTLIAGAKSRVKSFALAGVSGEQAAMIVTQLNSLDPPMPQGQRSYAFTQSAVTQPIALSSQKDFSP